MSSGTCTRFQISTNLSVPLLIPHGFAMAVWLVDFCIDNNLPLPKYYCHSMNPVGRDKIVGLLRSFQNSR